MNRLPIRTSSTPTRTSSTLGSNPMRSIPIHTSYRLAIGAATIILGLATGPTVASETTITRTCNPSGGGYNCYTTISRPPPPIEPAPLRGPITAEEVIIAPQHQISTTATATPPPSRNDNFCGTGYRMTPDGCAPN